MMAMAIVAMFMLTAFSIALVDNGADATGNGTQATPYEIYMTENDSFSYTATVNLEGSTITAGYNTSSVDGTYTALSSTAQSGITFASNTLSIANAVVGTYYVKIHAAWALENTNLEQSADQYLVFYITNDLDISKTETKLLFDKVGLTTSNVGTISVTNLMASTHAGNIVWTVSATGPNSADTSSQFQLVSTSNSGATLQIMNTAVTGTHTVTVTASQTGTTVANQSQSETFTVTVYEGATAIQGESITTFLGDTTYNSASSEFNGNFTVTGWESAATLSGESATASNIASFDGTSTAYTGATDEVSVSLLNTIANAANFGLVTSGASASTSPVSGTLTYTATGYSTGADPGLTRTIDWTVNYTVYPNLVFTSVPTLTSSAVAADIGNPLSIITSATATGANKVIFNWGDGRSDEVAVNSAQAMVSKSHTYGTAGVYQITMTAVNDFGSSSSVTLYNAGNDATLNPPAMQEITIKDGRDTSRTIGSITVEQGSTFRISQITIDSDAQTYMEKKKIVALYIEPADDGVFDATKKWNQGNQVFSTSPATLYADIQPTTQADDFFAEHGWLFIVFAILFILALFAIFYLGFHLPQAYIAAAVLLIVTILLFLYKDFGGIWDAITGLFH